MTLADVARAIAKHLGVPTVKLHLAVYDETTDTYTTDDGRRFHTNGTPVRD